jgi:hypothetical protein
VSDSDERNRRMTDDRRALTVWSWEKDQPQRDPAAPLSLWRVDAETSIKDPRVTNNEEWQDCEVLAFTARVMGVNTALIRADRFTADRLRGRRGIRAVEPAPDRRYFDDHTPTVVIVSGDGTCWERVIA